MNICVKAFDLKALIKVEFKNWKIYLLLASQRCVVVHHERRQLGALKIVLIITALIL